MKKNLKKIVPNSILSLYGKSKRKIMHARRKGNNVICPICRSTFKIFGNYGLLKRKNAECYNCGSLERHRLLWKYLDEKLNFFTKDSSMKLLHFAPERIFFKKFDKSDNIEYIPCDLFPEKYRYEGKSEIRKVDITKIPFNDNHFDFIICNHVLEHIPDDKLAMSELYRVLKKGGKGIFQVPLDIEKEITYEDFSIISPEDREKAFGQHDHVRIYGLDYKSKLENCGFDVYLDEFVKEFSKNDIFKYGFSPSETIYFCSKN